MIGYETYLNKGKKQIIYKTAGFDFIQTESSELNYDNILKSIKLGEMFEDICESLWLDSDVAGDYIKKYVLHLIFQEAVNFNIEDHQRLLLISDEEVCGQPIGEIMKEIFFESPIEWFSMLKYTEDKYHNSVELDEALERLLEYKDQDFVQRWKYCKSGSFYPLYLRVMAQQGKKSMTKQLNKIGDFSSELINKIDHLECFYKSLQQIQNLNPSQDMLEHELNSYTLFLLKTSSIRNLNMDSLNVKRVQLKSRRKDAGTRQKDLNKEEQQDVHKYFRYFATFMVVGDIRFKLYLADRFIKEELDGPYVADIKLVELFKLSFIIVPFLKEFIKEQLNSYANQADLKIKDRDNKINLKSDMKALKALKSRLFLYQILKTTPCYSPQQLIDEFKLNLVPEISEGLIGIWKYTDAIKWELQKKDYTKYVSETLLEMLKGINAKEMKIKPADYLDGCAYKIFTRYRELCLNVVETDDIQLLNANDFTGISEEGWNAKLESIGFNSEDIEKRRVERLEAIEEILLHNGIEVKKIKEVLEQAGIDPEVFIRDIRYWFS